MTPIPRPHEHPRSAVTPFRARSSPSNNEASPFDSQTPIISNCHPRRIPSVLELSPAALALPVREEDTGATRQGVSTLNRRDVIPREPPRVIDFVNGGQFGQTIHQVSNSPASRNDKDDDYYVSRASVVRLGTVVDNLDGAIASSAVWLMGACMRKVQHSLHTGTWARRHRMTTLPRLALQQQPRARTPTIPYDEDGDGLIHGIRNFGQTCFLNSVLQSLSASEPFMAYLEQVVAKYQERMEFEAWKLPLSGQDREEAMKESLSEVLVRILWQVNGRNKSDVIDPRAVLQAVGKENAQFRARYGTGSVGKEQQDAEELLQALVGIIVEDADLDTASSVGPSLFAPSVVNLEEGEDDDDDTITIMSCLREKRRSQDAQLLGRVVDGAPHTSIAISQLMESDEKLHKSSNVSNGVTAFTGRDDVFGETSSESRREEKKQEDFEVHIPHCSSEENMFPNGPTPSLRVPNLERLESLSDISKESKMSNAMQIMMTTISSVSTSPFSGWMGSALQCRTCRHVRPIQNAPFFDIPVVPAAVSNYLSGSQRSARGDPPLKNRHGSAGPPCTLEECLQEFTSVEAVQDVECRCCTLKTETANLQEDVDMLHGAFTSTLARAKRINGNAKEDDAEFKSLHDELRAARAKLARLRGASPDDDGPLDAILGAIQGDEFTSRESQSPQIKRCETLKCLLITRLPSILCIHIQRRYYDPNANRMSKTLQHVRFPEYLNMAPYCAYSEFGSMNSSWAGSVPVRPASGSRASIHYRLMSVIEHRGNAFHGHYVCYKRDPFTGRWLFVSDEVVKSVNWQDVQSCQAYMLFYEAM